MFGLLFEQEIFGKSLENHRKSFYDRFYNIERNEKYEYFYDAPGIISDF